MGGWGERERGRQGDKEKLIIYLLLIPNSGGPHSSLLTIPKSLIYLLAINCNQTTADG